MKRCLAHFAKKNLLMLLMALCVGCGKTFLSPTDDRAVDDKDQRSPAPASAQTNSHPEGAESAEVSSRSAGEGQKKGAEKATFSDELAPIGYFELSLNGAKQNCMGAYVGGFRFLTSLHCFTGHLSQGILCPKGMVIHWLDSNLSLAKGEMSVAYCNILRIARNGVDVVELQLADTGTMPSAKVSFLPYAADFLPSKQKVIGPQGLLPGVTFFTATGYVRQNFGTEFFANLPTAPGFSGSPILLDKTAQASSALPRQWEAVGLHLGSTVGFARGVWVSEILKHLEPK